MKCTLTEQSGYWQLKGVAAFAYKVEMDLNAFIFYFCCTMLYCITGETTRYEFTFLYDIARKPDSK